MITPTALVQFALDLGKATFDNTFDSLATLQAMAEDGALDVVRRATWLPDPLKAVFGECIGLLRRTRQDVRQTVDRCYLLLSDRAPDVAAETSAAPAPARHLTAPRRAALRVASS